MTRSIALIAFPMMVGLFVLREQFVAVAFGDSWKPLVEILAWFAPIGLLQSIGTTVGMLYLAKGRTDVMFRWGVGAGTLIVIAFIVGLQGGLVGVAMAYCFISLVLSLPSLYIPLRFINMPLNVILKGLVPALGSSLLMGAVLYLLNTMLNPHGGWALLGMILTGALVYGGISWMAQRDAINNLLRAAVNR
jgi:PST family polysaccharide transporter